MEGRERVLGGNEDRFQVSYKASDKNLHQKEGLESVVGEEQRFFVIRGLSAFTQYLVSVSAFTVMGTGPYAPVITVTTKEDSKWK